MLEFWARTQKTISPGRRLFRPSVFETILQSGGRMLETLTRLNFSMPAFLRASSKDWSFCSVNSDA